MQCASSTQYEEEAYTAEADRVCTDYTLCVSTEFEAAAGTKDADRVCQERQPCGPGACQPMHVSL